MFRSILVPLDGSRFGEHALPLALTLARHADARLELIHVHSLDAVYAEGAGYYLGDSLNDHLSKQHRAYLKRVAERIARVSSVQVNTLLFEGDVSEVIADHAAKHGTDLVVMTTHGRSALGRFWMGSVADELVRRLPIPVLLVRPSEEEPYLEKQPALKHLLLALDGTPLAEKMAEPTMELARLMGAEVTLLRAIQPVVPVTYFPHGAAIDNEANSLQERVKAMNEQIRKDAQDYLNGVVERFRPLGLRLHTRIVADDQPAAAILRDAHERGFDLVALETHGRHGLSRLLLGSVTDKVIRGAHVPVLVHRPMKA